MLRSIPIWFYTSTGTNKVLFAFKYSCAIVLSRDGIRYPFANERLFTRTANERHAPEAHPFRTAAHMNGHGRETNGVVPYPRVCPVRLSRKRPAAFPREYLVYATRGDVPIFNHRDDVPPVRRYPGAERKEVSVMDLSGVRASAARPLREAGTHIPAQYRYL